MRINREGYPTLIIVIVLLAVINIALIIWLKPVIITLVAIIGVSLIVFTYFLQFFRDPLRSIIKDENQLLCPADGKLVVIEETEEDEYFKDRRLQVSIFMSPFDVHCNRAPLSGTVKYIKYHPGKFLVAWHPKSSILNERSSIVVEMANGEDILIRQIAGAVARRIVTYPKVGDKLEQGIPFGFIKFGSRVDMFLPINTKIDPEIGQKVIAGLSIISSSFNSTN